MVDGNSSQASAGLIRLTAGGALKDLGWAGLSVPPGPGFRVLRVAKFGQPYPVTTVAADHT